MDHAMTSDWSDHAAAWTSDELQQRDDWRWPLSEAEVAEVQQAVARCADLSDRPETITPQVFPLETLGPKLSRIQQSLEHGSGLAWLQGLPVETWTQAESTIAFFGLCSYVGTAISQTAKGDRLFHVRDERLPTNHPQARGPSSNRKLSFHTDRCDVIGFLCLKQAIRGGENDIVSSMRLYDEMSRHFPELCETLRRPYLYQRHNVDLGNAEPYYELPVFSEREGHFACFLLRVLIERAYAAEQTPDMTDVQRQALDQLETLAEESRFRYRFVQQPGDLVLVNNFVTLHRRTEFEDHSDPDKRRHLLRLWLSVPNSRPLVPAFAPAFGAVEAGAIRGGMKPLAEG